MNADCKGLVGVRDESLLVVGRADCVCLHWFEGTADPPLTCVSGMLLFRGHRLCHRKQLHSKWQIMQLEASMWTIKSTT